MKPNVILLLALGILACTRDAGPPHTTVTHDAAPPDAAGQTAASPGVPRRCEGASLDGTGIGALRIGTPVDSVRAECAVVRDTTMRDVEGMFARVLSVALGVDTVEAEIQQGRVWRIAITRPGVRTADSLGVGTSLADLLALPDPRGITGEGALFIVSPARCGLSFELSQWGNPPRGGEWTTASLRRLPSSTVVRRVLVVGCSSEVSRG